MAVRRKFFIQTGGGGGGGGELALPELAADPDPPQAGDVWVRRTLENPAGTLQAFVGGVPIVTEQDDNKYEFSFRTEAGNTVRALLT